MKNLVLSLFLIFSFAVQGFGDESIDEIINDACRDIVKPEIYTNVDEVYYDCVEGFKKIFEIAKIEKGKGEALSKPLYECLKNNNCADCYVSTYFVNSFEDSSDLTDIKLALWSKKEICPLFSFFAELPVSSMELF